MENGKKSKDSQMVGDYGVEEWKDGGECPILNDKSTSNVNTSRYHSIEILDFGVRK